MTTNADRQTHETTDALIAEVRRLRADNIAPQSSRNRLVALTEQLADALEAAQSCTTCDGQPHASGKVCICGGSGRRADETQNLREGLQASQAQVAELDDMIAAHFLFHHDNKKDPPADLLEAVQFIVSVADAHAIRTGIDFPTHRATLRRYGLL